MPEALVPVPYCRPGCGACCIAPSISTAIPLSDGRLLQHKPAGLPCPQLDGHQRCGLFGQPTRPAVCASLKPSAEMCGRSVDEALHWLARLERETQPG